MPILMGLHILVALACAVHVIRTQRQMYWIMILFIFPALGSLVYVLAEVLPSLAGSPSARKAGSVASKALDPGREARDALVQVEISRTPGNMRRAADALLASNRPADALVMAREAATGAFAEDGAMMFTLARTLYETGEFGEALDQLEAMQAAHPDIRHPEAHLLYARTLEALGRLDEAAATYASVSDYFPGPEARARWAMLLEASGDQDNARARWNEILAAARHAPKFVKRTHRRWLDMARARA
ncbi:tetratricopeptide repeat protein [uncultured Maricaulis sp.]|uniref:tetratricopeptide repeat protein n=1 Tax=uncultured Maricaulis sp. TaxID=174710 RepID=UPI00260DF1B8|nr:tetratricopeptide repeat protein [uncultured Maricaulis sp.]